MEQNKQNIKSNNPERSTNWLASCGFIFPRNKAELARFDLLYGKNDPNITGSQIDPYQIIQKVAEAEQKNEAGVPLHTSKRKYKLVAGKLKPLPPHITKQLLKGDKSANKDSDKPNN